jgi:hypothetical protein
MKHLCRWRTLAEWAVGVTANIVWTELILDREVWASMAACVWAGLVAHGIVW